MSSKGRTIAKNLGKSIRKKFDSDSQTDDLQQSSMEQSPPLDSPIMQHFSTSGETKSSSSGSPPTIAKSTSLSTIGYDPVDRQGVDHSDILALTHDVKNFSDTLAKLKVLFLEGLETGDDARVVLQNSLGEVLAVLKNTMQRYPDLKTPEIFTAARVLINKIKAHDSEELQLDDDELQFYLDAIDQVALAFSRSVSEYLMGDMVNQQHHHLHSDTKVQSCDNLARSASQDDKACEKPEPKKIMTPEELDAVLLGLDAGLDLALQRAKAWSRYARDIISYIEKKSQLEMEYAKNLARIAHTMQPVLTNEGFLPLQSVFCTALSQDAEFASNLQASQALLHTSKFVEPLAARRNEHDRVRKSVKETWDREVRRMQETVNNLRKAQALYISRQQELERVRETLQKAEGDKMEKRKKSEEEALHKSAEAETTYKACVAEANHRQRSLEKTKVELLGKVRDQIHQCDQVIKRVTVDYFSLLHTVWSPVPVQYQTLCESSRGYEAGCQYAEFIRTLPSSASRPCRTEEFTFEPYSPGQKAGEARKISVHSNGSSGEHIDSNEGSPVSSPRRALLSDKYRIPVKAWGQNSGSQLVTGSGCSDTDSASGSNKSHESSPSSSPHDLLRRQIVSAQSLEELGEEDLDKLSGRATQKRSHMKRTATMGDEDCLDLPHLMGQQVRRNTTFGVDFQEQVEHYKSQVPPIITKCLAEIERRGVMIKGIYRVSGVKSKVESLCQRFDLNPELVDLEEVHPNIISNVLKLYLRQLPEPLLTFRLYSDFIHLAKENMSGFLIGELLLERLTAQVQKLPPSNFRTCAVLMHHLHRVAAHSELNHMSCSNLGIVFGPTLLRPLEGTASLASLVDTPHQTRAVELLITNAEAVFGPGDDYQLVPDQTPVEALESSPDNLNDPVISSSSEPSPERSPSKDIVDGFLATLPMPVPAMALTAAAAPSSMSKPPPPPPPPLPPASQSDESSTIVTDVVPSTPIAEPVTTDFSLPGSACVDKYDNVFISNSTSRDGVDGQGLSTADSDSQSSLEDEDDDDDVLLPDQSSAPNSHTHTPLLTPHCMAESMQEVKGAAPPARDHDISSQGSLHQACCIPRLADMDPAPETTLPSPLPAVVDSSTWPGPSGRGSASLPASPTIKPQHTSSSSAGSADGRISPSKDSRADRFKLEQRKLLSAIKSDPKLGMVMSEGSLSSARSDPKLSVSSFRDFGDQGDEGSVFIVDDADTQNVTVHPSPLSSVLVEGHFSSLKTVAGDDMTLASPEKIPGPIEQTPKQVSADLKKEEGRESVSEVSAAEETKAVSSIPLSSSSAQDSILSSPEGKADTKARKLSDYSSSGVKSQGSAGSTVCRSGIRLGVGSAAKLDSTCMGRSSSVTLGGKGSPTGKTARQSSSSVSQRRTTITGLSSGGGSVGSSAGPNMSPKSGQSRSLLTRYSPSITPSNSSSISSSSFTRRPIASVPPSSTVLGRSSIGSVPSVLRRPAPHSSPDSSPRGPSSSSPSSDSSPASSGSGAKVRCLSGDKSGSSSSREGVVGLRLSGNGSLNKTGVRTGLSSPHSLTAIAGKATSGGSASSRPGANGSSRVYSAVPTTTSTTSVGTGKAGVSSHVESSCSTKSVSSVVSSDGTVTTCTASGDQFQETSQDQKPAKASSFLIPGAKDLSSDRTPRFV